MRHSPMLRQSYCNTRHIKAYSPDNNNKDCMHHIKERPFLSKGRSAFLVFWSLVFFLRNAK